MEHNVEYYPLTYPQRGIWYTEKMYPDTSIGVVAGTLKIRGKINYELLERAISEYIFRNDTLRLHFVEIDGEPKQYYSKFQPVKIQSFEFSDINELYEWDIQRTQKPFDLVDSDLFEIDIIRISDVEAGVFIKMHHLITDGWSIVNCGNDIYSIYTQLLSGEEDISYNPPSYKDFIDSERNYLGSQKFLKDQEYWKGKYQTCPELTSLKTRKDNNKNSKAKRKSFVVPVRLTRKIFEYCANHSTSIFTLYFSALSIYLNRVAGKDDIVIGVPVLNRSNITEKNTFGMFINTIPLRIEFNKESNFDEMIENINREWLSALKHHKYSNELILKDIREKFNNIEELYDITLSYQNAKISKDNDYNHEGRWHFNGHQKQSLNIHINDRENDGTIVIDYDYLVEDFYSKEIDFIHDHVLRILWHALDNPIKNICKLDMVSESEKNKILYSFNQTHSDYPSEKSVIQLFEEQVEKTPGNIAVYFDNKFLTYEQLNRRVNSLAWEMINAGVKQDDIVAVLINRSIDAVTSILAIMKCRATFMPIDPSYPEERIKYIIDDASPKLICHNQSCPKIDFDGKWLDVSRTDDNQATNPKRAINNEIVYIIYTSGSTGKPKGAMITQRGLTNYITWANKVYVNGEKVTFPLYSSLSFDLTITSLFTPLISGNSMLIYRDDDTEATIMRVFNENKVDIVKLTPAHLSLVKSLDNSKSKIRKLIVGGEELKTELARQIFKSFNGNVEIFNEYGPTETVVGCMLYKFDYERDGRISVPIGKPADNVRIYILDRYMNPVPIGTPGELYIGGDGVCKGYLNRPELTSEKFISNPFDSNERLYKSGDLARWFPQGDVEYLGRIDYQVKIRGYRIELGEIEEQLTTHADVKEAVVVDLTDASGKKFLCAYIVTESGERIAELRSYLYKKLPHYMIPSYFVFLDKIPLTSNGKVDRTRLPYPETSGNTEVYIAPSGRIECIIADVFKEVLGIEQIGIYDNFFDLNVDSLTIIQIQAKLFKYDWKITTQDFYEYPNIKLLAERIQGKNTCENLSCSEVVNFTVSENNANRQDYLDKVLLTGSTGFLGSHILYELIKSTNSIVYCLVRGSDVEQATNKLTKVLKYYFYNEYRLLLDRVIVVNGDFSLDRFGLTADEYDRLGSKITSIIHSGALVKHYGDPDLFTRTNITGTEELIKFALKYDIKMNHISTVSIAGTISNGSYEFKESDFYFGQTLDTEYLKSKFKAEKLILDNIKKNDLKASIFRLGNITGRYSDGGFQINKYDNMFYNRICSIIKLKVFPESLKNLDIELSPVDYCSSAIVNLIKTHGNLSDIYHIFNDNRIPVIRLISLLNRCGNNIKIVNPEKFGSYLKDLFAAKAHDYAYYSFINDYRDNELTFNNNVRISNQKTIKLLNESGFYWPECNYRYIYKLYGDVEKGKYNSDEVVV